MRAELSNQPETGSPSDQPPCDCARARIGARAVCWCASAGRDVACPGAGGGKEIYGGRWVHLGSARRAPVTSDSWWSIPAAAGVVGLSGAGACGGRVWRGARQAPGWPFFVVATHLSGVHLVQSGKWARGEEGKVAASEAPRSRSRGWKPTAKGQSRPPGWRVPCRLQTAGSSAASRQGPLGWRVHCTS